MKARNLVALSFALPVTLVAWQVPVTAQEATASAPPALVAPPDPKAVEVDIERRREQLDRQWDRYRDWTSGRYWRQPPWETAQDEWWDARGDSAREAMRQHRLAMDRERDARMRWYDPWGQWRDDVDQMRRNAWDADQLAREQYFQSRRMYGPYGGGPRGGWWPY